MQATSMKGDGYYKAHSLIQRTVIDLSLPLIRQAALHIPLPGGDASFCLADYGCGQGKNSLIPVRASLDAVRARRLEQNFSVIHNDLPSNDFNSLLKDIHSDSQDSYLPLAESAPGQCGQIYVLVSASSFYSQVAPHASVHLGLSYSAMHWLSELPPGTVCDDIWQWGARADERRSLASRAASDWQTILELRAREMKADSRLVVSMAGAFDASGSADPLWHGDFFSAYRPASLLNCVLKEMVDEKLFDRGRYERFSMPFYERTLSEVCAPLEKGAPLSDAFAVEQATVEAVDCPLYARYQQNGDLAGYAGEIAATVRAFTEPFVIAALLAEPGAARHHGANSYGLSADGLALADEVYERMRAAVEANPKDNAFNIVQAMTVLRRI